jgi:ABC-type sulfate transport system permease component
VRSLGAFVVFLLLNRYSAWLTLPAAAQGSFVLGTKLSAMPELVSRVLDIPWLGPGLVVAVVLLLTLRGTRRAAYKPLYRRFRTPRLERHRGEIPRRHRDLEI